MRMLRAPGKFTNYPLSDITHSAWTLACTITNKYIAIRKTSKCTKPITGTDYWHESDLSSIPAEITTAHKGKVPKRSQNTILHSFGRSSRLLTDCSFECNRLIQCPLTFTHYIQSLGTTGCCLISFILQIINAKVNMSVCLFSLHA